jgi:type II secretory pathway pseudopilin PulG
MKKPRPLAGAIGITLILLGLLVVVVGIALVLAFLAWPASS